MTTRMFMDNTRSSGAPLAAFLSARPPARGGWRW